MMKDSLEKPHFVKDCYLFAGLNEEEFRGIDRITSFRIFKKNDAVFLEGEKADGFFFLCQGRVKLYKSSIEGKEQLLHIVYPGETFAEAAMFEGSSYPATAQVMEDSRLLFIEKKGFLAPSVPGIGVEDLSLKEVSSRVARYFLDVMDREGIPIRDGTEFKLEIARSDLAARLGTVRETLSRTLRRFRDTAVIEVDGKTIRILDKNALEQIAEGGKP